MYIKYRGSDNYTRDGKGFSEFLHRYNLKKEFYEIKEYKEKINEIKTKNYITKIDTEEKVLDIFIDGYVMSSIVDHLFKNYPNRTRKGLGYTLSNSDEDDEHELNIVWHEAIYTEEEALDVVVELIRKNNFSTEDIFNKVLQTS